MKKTDVQKVWKDTWWCKQCEGEAFPSTNCNQPPHPTTTSRYPPPTTPPPRYPPQTSPPRYPPLTSAPRYPPATPGYDNRFGK